ncbi:MAG: hypothetical protein KVP17_004981 [Porospora cf. gigantea B]|uniref:uncharacterized protein n=1 Tax=Porospora cf. gigantea B TaxID=2853592 RepID=UPI003571922D|nr:MAG: hypothetical protein KVP17_004981 [Porospora cf. gigantea B]
MNPWESWLEWVQTYENIVSGDPRRRAQAVVTLNKWLLKMRGTPSRLETALKSTVAVICGDTDNPRDLAATVLQVVTSHVDGERGDRRALQSDVVESLGLPPDLMAIRNQIAHGSMPSTPALRFARDLCVKFLLCKYWEPQARRCLPAVRRSPEVMSRVEADWKRLLLDPLVSSVRINCQGLEWHLAQAYVHQLVRSSGSWRPVLAVRNLTSTSEVHSRGRRVSAGESFQVAAERILVEARVHKQWEALLQTHIGFKFGRGQKRRKIATDHSSKQDDTSPYQEPLQTYNWLLELFEMGELGELLQLSSSICPTRIVDFTTNCLFPLFNPFRDSRVLEGISWSPDPVLVFLLLAAAEPSVVSSAITKALDCLLSRHMNLAPCSQWATRLGVAFRRDADICHDALWNLLDWLRFLSGCPAPPIAGMSDTPLMSLLLDGMCGGTPPLQSAVASVLCSIKQKSNAALKSADKASLIRTWSGVSDACATCEPLKRADLLSEVVDLLQQTSKLPEWSTLKDALQVINCDTVSEFSEAATSLELTIQEYGAISGTRVSLLVRS